MNRSGITGLLLGCACAAAAGAQNFADLKQSAVNYAVGRLTPVMDCTALAGYTGTEIIRLEGRRIAAIDGVPAHCRVSGVIAPEIEFELNLPARWNGRFYMIGNGGMAGESPDEPERAALRAAALRHAFAMASTNTGHDRVRQPLASFGRDDPQKLVDYAYRGVHLTALNSKRIANAYYGERVSYAYWNGCSTGGRQGLMEAQRFWDDFQGVIAGAPVLDFGGKTIGGLWDAQAQQQAPLTVDALGLIADRVYAKCDALDGLTDGLIDDPRRCDFDPERDVPLCAGAAAGPDCITSGQAAALRKMYGGVVSRGKPYFPGFPPGGEIAAPGPAGTAPGWLGTLVARGDAKTIDLAYAEATMQYLTYPLDRPDFDWRRFDFDRDTRELDGLRALADATNPDLARFRRRGGKILMYFGWAETLLPPQMGIDYYERASASNGPDTPEFFRLFMVPGMFHCRGGVGPNQFDPVTAIVNWVEKGVAPRSLVARQFDAQALRRSRPLCPYPQVARYRGSGSVDEAQNFSCVAP
jgi:hypothetical protein